jgi:hypothetical protein
MIEVVEQEATCLGACCKSVVCFFSRARSHPDGRSQEHHFQDEMGWMTMINPI